VFLFKLSFWDGLLFGGFGFCLLEKEEELVRSSEQGILGSCCVGDLWTVVSELCVCWSLVGFGLILDACGTDGKFLDMMMKEPIMCAVPSQ
jgi:hypothetical protein